MSYLILARKYRPQQFSDLTGQETTAKILQAAILKDRIASAYLFSGPRGIGKTTSARLFAKAINCHKRSEAAEPCNACPSCEEIAKSSSIDVLELDAASHTQVDNIREVVINTVGYAPVRDRYKIFIIDEVHMLSSHSFNALLKTLEEPPSHVVFILATTEFHKIPATISSRCQRFRFLPLTQKNILETLKNIATKENIPVEEDALALLARSAGGAMRDALSLFDQTISHLPAESDKKNLPAITLTKIEEILGVVREDFMVEFIEKIANRDAKGVLESTDKLLTEGFDLSYFLKELRETFREMLILKCGYGEGELNTFRKKKLPINRFTLEELLRDSQLLSKCADQMRWNDFPRVVFECYAVRLCQDAYPLSEIVDRLERLEGGNSQGNIPPLRKSPTNSFSAPKATSHVYSDSSKSYASPKSEPTPTKDVQNSVPPSTQATSTVTEVVSSAQESSVAVLEREESSNSNSSWAQTLQEIHQTKPSLHSILQSANTQWNENRLDLSISGSFAFEGAKRNQKFLEDYLSKKLNKPVQLTIKQNENAPTPIQNTVPTEVTAPTITEEPLEVLSEEEPMGEMESFESTDPSGSAIDDAKEDKGVQTFLKHFSGSVTKNPSSS